MCTYAYVYINISRYAHKKRARRNAAENYSCRNPPRFVSSRICVALSYRDIMCVCADIPQVQTSFAISCDFIVRRALRRK